MKKLLIPSVLILFLLTGCSNNTQNNSNNYNTQSISYEENIFDVQNTVDESQTNNIQVEIQENKPEEIGKYSTKIYDKDEERQHNLELTCSKVDMFTVKSGETFSFCDVVGKATPQAGYEKAKIFDKDGNVKEGYGGR